MATETRQDGMVGLEDLPDDILSAVADRLCVKDCAALACTSKALHRACSMPSADRTRALESFRDWLWAMSIKDLKLYKIGSGFAGGFR